MHLEMDIMARVKCREIYSLFGVELSGSKICTVPKFEKGIINSCYEASGNALIQVKDGSYTAIGIASASFLPGKVNQGLLTTYIEIATVKDWITYELLRVLPEDLQPQKPDWRYTLLKLLGLPLLFYSSLNRVVDTITPLLLIGGFVLNYLFDVYVIVNSSGIIIPVGILPLCVGFVFPHAAIVVYFTLLVMTGEPIHKVINI